MAKVSIIVPIYNVEKYLPKCLDSLVNQTLDDIEIILVNDGSTDNSGIIAKQYYENHKNKIKYLEKENGGLSDARNFGIPYATGEYIAFLDSDDYIEIDSYKQMHEKAKEEDADYIECDFIWEYPNKQIIDKRLSYNNKQEMLTNVRVVAWNKLIKREIIIKNNLKFPKGLRYEDIEFTYKLIPLLNKVSYIDKPFIHYVQRNNSIANVQNEKTADIFAILENVEKYYIEKNLYNEYKDQLEYNYARYLLCSSLKRICKVENKEKRKDLINKTWNELNTKYPNWHKNKILKTVNSGKNLYIKSVNKFSYKIYTKIFSFI